MGCGLGGGVVGGLGLWGVSGLGSPPALALAIACIHYPPPPRPPQHRAQASLSPLVRPLLRSALSRAFILLRQGPATQPPKPPAGPVAGCPGLSARPQIAVWPTLPT